ncbi:MAG: hypothetical protein CL752_05695 [Chloroflexi bacterium]|jgi:hypothetical protein|nr:hypothetical protein [Chloroflexota bacterium]MCH2523717.1 hypothetical protein [Dehalococcoidia bacterium]|tara:strand:+ start:1705 stop:2448 length:744 start_codon:yes stop_codon:yes gene_type:complete
MTVPDKTKADFVETFEDLHTDENSLNGPLEPQQATCALINKIESGEHWYTALLDVINLWSVPYEEIDGVTYHYLIDGEAFNWLLLAQRLLDEILTIAPNNEIEKLLLYGIAPMDITEAEFARLIGGPKYRAHLNFQYGVTVEEVILLSAELELEKAGVLSNTGKEPPDVLAYQRVYGKSLAELQIIYATQTGIHIGKEISQNSFQRFIYWLSKYRLRNSEPARLASDTRKALSLISRMENHRKRRFT